MIRNEHAALLVIDIQERLISAMKNSEKIINAAEKLVKGAKVLDLPILCTEQYPERLGPTVSQIATHLDDERISKLSFSCGGSDQFRAALQKTNRKQIIVCGIETHVCVHQTVLDLLDGGYDVHVVADAVDSRKESDRDIALQRMQAEGAKLASVEMLLFELLKEAGTPLFKKILDIVK